MLDGARLGVEIAKARAEGAAKNELEGLKVGVQIAQMKQQSKQNQPKESKNPKENK